MHFAAPYYFLLLIFVSTTSISIMLIIKCLLKKNYHQPKSNILKKTEKLFIFIFSSILVFSIFQGAEIISTRIYVILIALLILLLNYLILKNIKKFVNRIFPRFIKSHVPVEKIKELIKTFNITRREMEIIELICLGKSNKEIEDKLFISIQTVKDHIYNIYQKTGVKNRVQLTNLFR